LWPLFWRLDRLLTRNGILNRLDRVDALRLADLHRAAFLTPFYRRRQQAKSQSD